MSTDLLTSWAFYITFLAFIALAALLIGTLLFIEARRAKRAEAENWGVPAYSEDDLDAELEALLRNEI